MIIGIGTDIIEIKRIDKAVTEGKSFFNKVYTVSEREYYIKNKKHVETLAGLFCAKEAVSKAMGTGFRGFSLCDIEIIPNELGKPQVTLYGQAKEISNTLKIRKMHVTISHSREYATAFAIAEGDDLNEITNT